MPSKLLTFTLAIGALLYPSLLRADPPARELSQKQIEDVWKEISAPRPPFAGDPDDPEQRFEYWADVAEARCEHFETICLAKNVDEAIKFYVDQFGQHGDEADLLWVLASAPYTFGESTRPGYLRRNPHLAISEAFSKEVVHRFVKDARFRDRYYRVVLWSGITIVPNGSEEGIQQFSDLAFLTHSCHDLFHEKPAKNYWYAARNFALLWHATSWDRPLSEVPPKRLHEHYDDFYEELGGSNLYKLILAEDGARWGVDDTQAKPADKDFFLNRPVLKLPEKPFDTWTESPALRPELFRKIWKLAP